MSLALSTNGFLLLDTALNVLAANQQALEILSFPTAADQIKQPKVFLADRVRITLVDRKQQGKPVFFKEFRSGKRRYVCRSFHLEHAGAKFGQPVVAVLLERDSAGSVVSDLSRRFDLTERERQTVDFLMQGLTSKEIAARMNISPNTVKAFLRLVMVKMKVSTRSGIAGKIAGSRNGDQTFQNARPQAPYSSREDLLN
jgi:DNA-binding CsgD family transcriptional regulator